MKPLTKTQRELLASRVICCVCEPWIDHLLTEIPHKGRRVLVPIRLRERFEAVVAHGGILLELNVRHIVQQLARTKLGVYYHACAVPKNAPIGYSCSTLTYWMYAFVGLHLPRYAIDQSYVGRQTKKPVAGGLAFYENRFPLCDRDRKISHVGIVTRKRTLIHGSYDKHKVVEEPIPRNATMYTDPLTTEAQLLVIIPHKIHGVRTALDLARWLERPLT